MSDQETVKSVAFAVRPAQASDSAELQRLYQERVEFYLKQEPRLPQAANDYAAWAAALATCLERPDAAVLVAERATANGAQLIGYIIGWVWQMPPNFEAGQVGLVSELSVDSHCKQGGVGTALLSAMGDWFKAQGLRGFEVRVPRQHPIEQAFWRSAGAEPFYDHLYYRLA